MVLERERLVEGFNFIEDEKSKNKGSIILKRLSAQLHSEFGRTLNREREGGGRETNTRMT